MNMLENIPPNVRTGLYWTSFIVGIALGATLVAYQGSEVPRWLEIASNVYAFVGSALGITAASNVSKTKSDPTPGV